MKILCNLSVCILICCSVSISIAQSNSSIERSATNGNEDYLLWSASQAEKIGKSMRSTGKAGSAFDFRVIHTDHAINYKLRATLMTPEVIKATARLEQLRNRLSDDEARELVAEADAAGDLVVMIEIDPREGSGVIPLDWRVFLQPKGFKLGEQGAVNGIKSPEFRKIKALAGVARRDYDYDVFWVSFPLVDENKTAIFADNLTELDLFVGIYNKEGKVSWRMPESVKQKMAKLLR